MNLLFPTQAIQELASEFKLLRKDIQAIKESVANIEAQFNSQSKTSLKPKPYEKPKWPQ